MLILRTSKTHWRDNKPQIVKISSNPIENTKKLTSNDAKDKFCPFRIIQDYVLARLTCESDDEPFFVYGDRTPVAPENLRSTLKKMLKLSGLDSERYRTHGFRTGRSLDLRRMNLSIESIKFLGRWRSNCVFSYLSYI